MRIDAMYHEAKSKYAYPVNATTIHLWFRAAKGECDSIEVIAGDPFNWRKGNDETYHWEGMLSKRIPMIKKYTTTLYDYFFTEISSDTRRIKYAFVLSNQVEDVFYGARYVYDNVKDVPEQKLYDLYNYFNYPFINEEDIFTPPPWVEQTVWYQIFPDRFHRGSMALNKSNSIHDNKQYGGTIQGVIEKLDYIKDLGCNGIYFTPLFEAYSYHKYDTTNYYKIDPSFGTNDDLKRLVKEAHDRGIKVMLDAVFNHVGWFHPMWQDVVINKQNSQYIDCFHIIDKEDIFKGLTIDENNKPHKLDRQQKALGYHVFGHTPMMPKWNTNHPLVQQELLGAAMYWITECDIDGWRLDVSNEVSHDFWRLFHKAVKSTKEDIYIVGENMDFAEPWIGPDQFDSVMNYDLAMPIYGYLCHQNNHATITKEMFINAIYERLVAYPMPVLTVQYNVLDTHDTDRILTMVDDDVRRVRLPLLFLFTFTGSPSIYYGTEQLMSGRVHGNSCRQPLDWNHSSIEIDDMLDFMKRLIRARKTYDVFRSVDLTFLSTNNEHVLAYTKTTPTNTLYVVMNNQDKEVVLDIDWSCTGFNPLTEQPQDIQHSTTLQAYEYQVVIRNN